jgi:hypothetical protein
MQLFIQDLCIYMNCQRKHMRVSKLEQSVKVNQATVAFVSPVSQLRIYSVGDENSCHSCVFW